MSDPPEPAATGARTQPVPFATRTQPRQPGEVTLPAAVHTQVIEVVRLASAGRPEVAPHPRARARTGSTRVLFTGSSGTGRTTAAEVVASELRAPLLTVDLSRVVSQWIGETEKNLDRVLREAEESGAVLLLDEADALFGRRSDVQDSSDRYANVETSALLQRIEAYDGLVILSSNRRSSLDAAFLRRCALIVDVP